MAAYLSKYLTISSLPVTWGWLMNLNSGNISRLYEFLMKFNVFIYAVNPIAPSEKADPCS